MVYRALAQVYDIAKLGRARLGWMRSDSGENGRPPWTPGSVWRRDHHVVLNASYMTSFQGVNKLTWSLSQIAI